MSKALGVGTRVYVEYEPRCEEPGIGCSTGTIQEGPFSAGHVFGNGGERFCFPTKTWGVQLDGECGFTAIEERLLTPIDDPDPATLDQTAEVEA